MVDLVVPDGERAARVLEADPLPKVKLSKIDLEWVHVISEGWASPLRGFMREEEYLQSLHFNCLKIKDGSLVNMSLPIVLAIADDVKDQIGSSPNVGLLGPNGDLVGILRRLVNLIFEITVDTNGVLWVFVCCIDLTKNGSFLYHPLFGSFSWLPTIEVIDPLFWNIAYDMT